MLEAKGLTWGYHWGLSRSSPFLSLSLPLPPDTPSWSLQEIVMATLQQNYQNTFMLTIVPDEALILSEAETFSRMLKS